MYRQSPKNLAKSAVLGIELDLRRSEQLLKRPTPRKPEVILKIDETRRFGHVDDADGRAAVPTEHGTYGLFESSVLLLLSIQAVLAHARQRPCTTAMAQKLSAQHSPPFASLQTLQLIM